MPSRNNGQSVFALIADIGGTNTRLQLVTFKEEDLRPKEIKSTVYKTKEEHDLRSCLEHFLAEFRETETWPQIATMAVAGAPLRNKMKMVNIHWPEIDGDKLGKEFNIPSFTLINDSEAIGYSVSHLTEDDLLTIHDVPKLEGGNRAVAGSGTGLGECILHATRGENGNILYKVSPSEGGHKDFCPMDRLDFEYQQYCLENNPVVKEMQYLSTERAFCGPAIPHIYKFFARRERAEEKELSSKDIFEAGKNKADPFAEKALAYYAKLYGKEVSNFALDCLPTGGIFLTGSMINSLTDYMTKDGNGHFMKSYLSKDRATNRKLEKFPIYIVTNQDVGILGAFAKARMDAFYGDHLLNKENMVYSNTDV